jgi:hypothetical protein
MIIGKINTTISFQILTATLLKAREQLEPGFCITIHQPKLYWTIILIRINIGRIIEIDMIQCE